MQCIRWALNRWAIYCGLLNQMTDQVEDWLHLEKQDMYNVVGKKTSNLS